jgi:hypothetical protein
VGRVTSPGRFVENQGRNNPRTNPSRCTLYQLRDGQPAVPLDVKRRGHLTPSHVTKGREAETYFERKILLLPV